MATTYTSRRLAIRHPKSDPETRLDMFPASEVFKLGDRLIDPIDCKVCFHKFPYAVASSGCYCRLFS